jgi:hypothetical protein
MSGHYFNGMDHLTERDIERIYLVTDQLHLHRDWVIVPLGCATEAFELVQPDGKLLLRPPGGELFEPWLHELAARLSALDLSRIARLGVDDPVKHLTGTHAPRAYGTQRYLEGLAGQNIGRNDEVRLPRVN